MAVGRGHNVREEEEVAVDSLGEEDGRSKQDAWVLQLYESHQMHPFILCLQQYTGHTSKYSCTQQGQHLGFASPYVLALLTQK
jgi:hypothetical protein